MGMRGFCFFLYLIHHARDLGAAVSVTNFTLGWVEALFVQGSENEYRKEHCQHANVSARKNHLFSSDLQHFRGQDSPE